MIGNDSYQDLAAALADVPSHAFRGGGKTNMLMEQVTIGLAAQTLDSQGWDALLLDVLNPPTPEFRPFGKIPRLFRDITITEKIDGTNACIVITEGGDLWAQSRKRIITPADDNFGFAAWVHEHGMELYERLGPGYHYGEWFGRGIQRGYGLDHRRFALFNVGRWTRHEDEATDGRTHIPPDACGGTLDVVAKLYTGPFETFQVNAALRVLRSMGSQQVPGFKNPEGVIIWHDAAGCYFKATLDNDGKPKGQD